MKKVHIFVAISLLFLIVFSCVPQTPNNNNGGQQAQKDIYGWKLEILNSTNPSSGIPVSKIEGKVIYVSGTNAIISDATTAIYVYKANLSDSDIGKKMIIENSTGKTYNESLEIDLSSGTKQVVSDDSTIQPVKLNVNLDSSKQTRALWDIRYVNVSGKFTGKDGSVSNTYEFEYETESGTSTISVYPKTAVDSIYYKPNATIQATLTGYTKYYNGVWEFVPFSNGIEIQLPSVSNFAGTYNPNTGNLTLSWESDITGATFELTMYYNDDTTESTITTEKIKVISISQEKYDKLVKIEIIAKKGISKSATTIIEKSEIQQVNISPVTNLSAKFDDYNGKIYLSWEYNDTSDKFLVYRKSGGEYTLIKDNLTSTSCELIENDYENLEGYAVSAVVNGEEGPKSEITKGEFKYTFAGGNGTASEPYLIGTANQLKLLGDSEYLTKGYHYKLIQNIDLSSVIWTPIGNYSSDLSTSAFQGTLDGDYHKITNLTFNDTNRGNAGLFGYLYNATVKNLVIENANVTAKQYVGILSGSAKKSMIYKVGVRNSTVEGTINNYVYAGGLIGDVSGGVTIEECFADNITVSGPNYDNARLGGLIGRLMHSTDGDNNVSKSYATGTVKFKSKASSNIGGLIGLTSSATGSTAKNYINQSYAAVAPFNIANDGANTNWKGFVGGASVIAENPTIKNYFDTNVSATTSGSASASLQDGFTTAQMKSGSNFVGWDFTNVWTINEGNDYPRLKWEQNEK
ncbi:MAG: hypothetical protein ACK4E1_07270 [Fervidobacterium nodosum]